MGESIKSCSQSQLIEQNSSSVGTFVFSQRWLEPALSIISYILSRFCIVLSITYYSFRHQVLVFQPKAWGNVLCFNRTGIVAAHLRRGARHLAGVRSDSRARSVRTAPSTACSLGSGPCCTAQPTRYSWVVRTMTLSWQWQWHCHGSSHFLENIVMSIIVMDYQY